MEGYGSYEYYWHDTTTFLGLWESNQVMTNITFNKSKNIEFYISAGKRAYAYYTKVND